jgi:hypothetical protein
MAKLNGWIVYFSLKVECSETKTVTEKLSYTTTLRNVIIMYVYVGGWLHIVSE